MRGRYWGRSYLSGMAVVAMLASHWNLPIFGWVSNDHSLEDRSVYSTLVRLLGPLNQFCKNVCFCILLLFYSFALIEEELYTSQIRNATFNILVFDEKFNTVLCYSFYPTRIMSYRSYSDEEENMTPSPQHPPPTNACL